MQAFFRQYALIAAVSRLIAASEQMRAQADATSAHEDTLIPPGLVIRYRCSEHAVTAGHMSLICWLTGTLERESAPSCTSGKDEGLDLRYLYPSTGSEYVLWCFVVVVVLRHSIEHAGTAAAGVFKQALDARNTAVPVSRHSLDDELTLIRAIAESLFESELASLVHLRGRASPLIKSALSKLRDMMSSESAAAVSRNDALLAALDDEVSS
jgi:hypothetical protein